MLVVVVARLDIMGHGVTDNTVEQGVSNGLCQGGWWRWFQEGYIVVWFVRAGVEFGRWFQVGWVIGIG